MGIAKAWKRSPRPWRPQQRRNFPGLAVLLLAAAIGAAGYYGFSEKSGAHPRLQQSVRFEPCGTFTRNDCVIDGDTFFFRGERVRIADIDAPETSGAQCAAEAALGARATRRLRE